MGTGALSQGLQRPLHEFTTHIHLVRRLRISGISLRLPAKAFMEWTMTTQSFLSDAINTVFVQFWPTDREIILTVRELIQEMTSS